MALTTHEFISLWSGTICVAVSGFLVAHWISLFVTRHVNNTAESWEYDAKRLIQIRTSESLFRWFEPLVKELENLFGDRPPIVARKQLDDVKLALARGGSRLPFELNEFIAYYFFLGLVVGVLLFPISISFTSATNSFVIAVCSPFAAVQLAIRRLKTNAAIRLKRLKFKLPFSVDLMSLMMKAGATFPESLRSAVQESDDSPAGEELELIHRLTVGGKTFDQALQQLKDRMCDEEINEVVLSIQQSTDLGTPLSETLLNLADQMRLRQTQRQEKQASQAKAMMNYPQLILFVSCVVVVMAPIVVEYLVKSST